MEEVNNELPQKPKPRPGNAVISIVASVVVIIVLSVVWYMKTRTSSTSSNSVDLLTVTASAIPTAQNSNTTDASITSDLSSIDSNISKAATEENSANSAINDQQTNLNY
jgi:hypothetical protein